MSTISSWTPGEYISFAALLVAAISLLLSFSTSRKQHKYHVKLGHHQNMQEFYALLNEVVATKNKADVNIKKAIDINKKVMESIKSYREAVADDHYMSDELSGFEEFEEILEGRKAKVDEWDQVIGSMWSCQNADQQIWQALNQLNSVLNTEITQIEPMLVELENRKNTMIDSIGSIENSFNNPIKNPLIKS